MRKLLKSFFLAGKKWFPHAPGEPDSNPPVGDNINLYDAHHGIAMGVVDSSCDDGKVSMTDKNHYIFVIISYTSV